MTTTKHTPGPWIAGQFLSRAENAEAPEGMTVLCRVDGIPIMVARNTLCDDPMADARLVAAAPELLAALRNLQQAVADAGQWLHDRPAYQRIVEWSNAADAALAKANAAEGDQR